MVSSSPLTSFTFFPDLPAELQLEIWSLAAPEPTPEICIVWPLNIRDEEDEQLAQPFVVDTAWPAVAHVCQAAREVLLKSGQLRLRHSPTAGFAVPFRAFDPAIDTLYWSRIQESAMNTFISQPENRPLLRALRHVAVDMPTALTPYLLVRLIRESAIFIRTISVVLPSSDSVSTDLDIDPYGLGFLTPARRCRLFDIPADNVAMISIGYYALSGCLLECRKHMNKDSRAFVFGDDAEKGTAWSAEDNDFSGLEIKAQTFVEYAGARYGGALWHEACGLRIMGDPDEMASPLPHYVPVADRKNPEEYRVLDDDSEWPEGAASLYPL